MIAATDDAGGAAAPVRATTSPRLSVAQLACLAWAVLATIILVANWSTVAARYGDSDDAMRLVEVRDWLAGQAWTDLVQHRLGPPDGVDMHWSRLVDGPIAALIVAFGWVADPDRAERLARALWPLLAMLPLLLGAAAAADRLAGRNAAWAALALVAMSAPGLALFLPGRIDHHNIQLAGTVLVLALALSPRRRARDGAMAGMLIALGLAVGLEMLPVLAFLAAALSLEWCREGRPLRPFVVALHLAMATTAAFLFLATTSPAHWGSMVCDRISPAYLLPLGTAAMGFAALAGIDPRSTSRRTIGAGLIAAVALGTAGWLAPTCLRGPYAALDPRLTSLWLDNVLEARSILAAFAEDPRAAIADFAMPLAAIVLALLAAWHARQRRRAWGLLAAVLVLQVGLAAWQARGGPLAHLLAAITIGATMTALAPRIPWAAIPLAVGLVGLVAATGPVQSLLFPGRSATIKAFAGGLDEPCRSPSRLPALDRYPPGQVLAELDAGPAILAATHHSAMAGPYHRAGSAILDDLDAFAGSPDQAREIAARRSVDYVLVCRMGAPAPDPRQAGSFGELLLAGRAPDWLRRLPLDGGDDMLFFAVARNR